MTFGSSAGGIGFGVAIQLYDFFTGPAYRVQRSMQSLNLTTTNFAAGMNKQMNALKATFAGFAASAGVVALAVVPGMMAAKYDAMEAQFEVMLGSAKLAKQTLAELRNFAKTTPFGVDETIDSAKRLLAFGIPLKDLMGDLRMLGDVATAVGKENLNPIILAYGQSRTKGFLMGDELRQFAERSVPFMDSIKKYFKETEGLELSGIDAFDKIRTRQITFKMMRDMLKQMTSEGGRFANMMERMEGRPMQMLDRIGGEFYEIGLKFGQAVLEAGAPMLTLISGIASTLNDISPTFIGEIAVKIALVAGSVAALASAAYLLAKAPTFAKWLTGSYMEAMGQSGLAQYLFNNKSVQGRAFVDTLKANSRAYNANLAGQRNRVLQRMGLGAFAGATPAAATTGATSAADAISQITAAPRTRVASPMAGFARANKAALSSIAKSSATTKAAIAKALAKSLSSIAKAHGKAMTAITRALTRSLTSITTVTKRATAAIAKASATSVSGIKSNTTKGLTGIVRATREAIAAIRRMAVNARMPKGTTIGTDGLPKTGRVMSAESKAKAAATRAANKAMKAQMAAAAAMQGASTALTRVFTGGALSKQLPVHVQTLDILSQPKRRALPKGKRTIEIFPVEGGPMVPYKAPTAQMAAVTQVATKRVSIFSKVLAGLRANLKTVGMAMLLPYTAAGNLAKKIAALSGIIGPHIAKFMFLGVVLGILIAGYIQFQKVLKGTAIPAEDFIGLLQRIGGAISGVYELLLSWNGEYAQVSLKTAKALSSLGILDTVAKMSVWFIRLKELFYGAFTGFVEMFKVVGQALSFVVWGIAKVMSGIAKMLGYTSKVAADVRVWRILGAVIGVYLAGAALYASYTFVVMTGEAIAAAIATNMAFAPMLFTILAITAAVITLMNVFGDMFNLDMEEPFSRFATGIDMAKPSALTDSFVSRDIVPSIATKERIRAMREQEKEAAFAKYQANQPAQKFNLFIDGKPIYTTVQEQSRREGSR